MSFFVQCLSAVYVLVLILLGNTPIWPKKFWWIANLVSISPLWLLYFPAAAGLIYGILRKRKSLILLNGASFLLIFFCIMGWNIPFSKIFRSPKPESLTILTINLGARPLKLHFLEPYVKELDPDVILFQESGDYIMKFLRNSFKTGWDIHFQGGLGIISRYKIVDSTFLARNDPDRKGTFLFEYTLATPYGPIHLFNVHLQTPRKGLEPLINNGPGAYSKMQDVTAAQEKESRMASESAARQKNVLVAGDFNMVALNPIFRTYWSTYQDAHSKTGWGFGYTKNTGWHGLRIDHVLADKNWQVLEIGPGVDIGSDHRPVFARLAFIGKPEELAQQTDAEHEVPSGDTYYSENSEVKGTETVHPGVKLKDWPTEVYPRVKFRYKIPPEVPVVVRVLTSFNDWICLGGTATATCPHAQSKEYFTLIDDGQWHDIEINVDVSVKTVLAAVKDLQEWQFFIPKDRLATGEYWIRNFSISK